MGSVVMCLVFAAFIAFVLLGCSLFLTPGNLLPTLISSGMVILPVLTMVRSGKLPSKYSTGNHKVTSSLSKHLTQWKDVTKKTDALITAKSTKDRLAAADKVEKL